MYHEPNARHFRTDVDYGPGWRQARRNGININEDIAPDDVSLLGPPTRGRPRSAADLAAYGYSGQGYPIYGQPRGSTRHDAPEPSWFADPSSAAYAYGYTTSLRSNDPFPGAGHHVGAGPSRGHAGQGPKDYQRADSRILEDVCDRLSDDDDLDASDITVSVIDGEVILAGTVIDRYCKRRAEDLAVDVRGVFDVQNHLSARRGLLRELGGKLVGDDDQHHGHHGQGPRAEALAR